MSMILASLREMFQRMKCHLRPCRLLDELPFERDACGVPGDEKVVSKAYTMKLKVVLFLSWEKLQLEEIKKKFFNVVMTQDSGQDVISDVGSLQ
jgi:hypothetical protein